MPLRYLILGAFVFFEVANFTGFSWTRLRRLSDEELITAAIQYEYPDIYSSSADLKADYPSFSPEVYYWADLTAEAGNQFWNKFFGYKLFSVRLPEKIVLVASNGIARFSRNCRDGERVEGSRCSPVISPDPPRFGIVGLVRGGPPSYKAAKEFSIRWVNGSAGSVFVSGHCFSAFSQSLKPALKISVADDDGFIITDQYGYLLVDIPDITRAGYGSVMIPEREFAQLRKCDAAEKAVTSKGAWWQERFARTSD